ncbi:MAG: MBL fold metallo-hydrolase [Treponema sp.]|jgi:phosphoribosyl 1,2-cyclic phosphate phosphodiesterase|nr:MBL fold metallo-hydrolase [Treponema sp.]
MKLRVLGSGTSDGIPVLGCGCPVCRSTDRRDRRLRSSLLIRGAGGEQVVIDTGPEFRIQALRAGIRRLDAVFLTHSHADHIHGMDDVRPFSRENPLPVYGNRETIKELTERFSYVFKETQRGGGKPRIIPIVATVSGGPIVIGGLRFSPVPVIHGALPILGWRVDEGSAAAVYLTDTSEIPGPSWPLIGKPGVLIIGGLRTRPHPTHFNFEQALDAAVKTGARQSLLTHICHDYSHRDLKTYCRNYRKERGIGDLSLEPAYDGLELDV